MIRKKRAKKARATQEALVAMLETQLQAVSTGQSDILVRGLPYDTRGEVTSYDLKGGEKGVGIFHELSSLDFSVGSEPVTEIGWQVSTLPEPEDEDPDLPMEDQLVTVAAGTIDLSCLAGALNDDGMSTRLLAALTEPYGPLDEWQEAPRT